MLIDPSKTVIYAQSIKPHDTRKGLSTCILPSGRVFSCQPDGSSGDRDPGADGGYEACKVSGSLATFQPVDGKYYSFAVVVVEGL